MKRYFLLLVSACLAWPVSAGILSAEETKPAQGILRHLARDARLAHKVTLSLQGSSLDETMEELRTQTGVSLVCSRNCEDQKVQVYVTDCPLIEVMAGLETLLPGHWTAEETGPSRWIYRFRMEEEAIKMRQAWWRDTGTLMDAARELRKQYQRDHLEENLKRCIEAQPSLEEPSNPDITPLLRQGGQIIASLPDRYKEMMIDQAKFLQGGSYASARLPESWIPVSELSQKTRDLVNDLIPRYNETWGQEIGQFNLPDGDPQIMNKAMLGFSNVNGKLDLHLKVPGSRSSIRSPVGYLDAGNEYLRAFSSYNHTGLASPRVPLSKDAMEEQYGKEIVRLAGRLAAIQKSTFWPAEEKTSLSSLKVSITDDDFPFPSTMQWTGRKPRPHVTLPGLLSRLAAKTGIPIIADYYTPSLSQTYRLSDGFILPVASPPFENACQKIGKWFDYSWKVSRGVLLWRHNRWYREDAFQVPNRLMSRWRQALLKAWEREPLQKLPYTPDLDVYAEIVTTLTLDQIRIGLSDESRFLDNSQGDKLSSLSPKARQAASRAASVLSYASGDIQRMSGLVLFYATLPPLQREQIKARGLPVQSLSPESQEALAALIRREPMAYDIRPEEIPGSAICIERTKDEMARFRLVFIKPG